MFDRIDPRSPTPLYAQIATRVRMAIAAGELTPGTALPSVRQLATQLRVNPATVVQAYRELETEGLVATRHGAGTYVQELGSDRKARERRSEARRLVRELLDEAGRLGITIRELREAVEEELAGPGLAGGNGRADGASDHESTMKDRSGGGDGSDSGSSDSGDPRPSAGANGRGNR